MSEEPGKRLEDPSQRTSLDANPPGDQHVEFVNAEPETLSSGTGRLSAGRGAILANAARELQDVAAKQPTSHTSNSLQPLHLGTRRSRPYGEPVVPPTWTEGPQGKKYHRQMPVGEMVAPTQPGIGEGYNYSSYKRPPLFTQAPKHKVHRPKSPIEGHSRYLAGTLKMLSMHNNPPQQENDPNNEIDTPPAEYMDHEPPYTADDGGVTNQARGGNVVVYDQYDPDIHPHPPPDPQLYGFGVPQQVPPGGAPDRPSRQGATSEPKRQLLQEPLNGNRLLAIQEARARPPGWTGWYNITGPHVDVVKPAHGGVDLLRDHLLRDHLFKDHLFKDHLFKGHLFRDRLFKDCQFRDRQFRDRQFRDRQFRDRQFRDRQFRDRQFRDRQFRDRLFRDQSFQE
ncbi:vacuolar protein sorting-associated protein 4 [Aspergillus tubingensis]|uniref:vacuolar protein sorting-associated protein 4 n=1 Tax=Aspergillus tubingensis TaxID=5068 RepID=UPI001579C5C6|nr:vacuolar protein sorting-associated protein 4 [Aspergillus tubingensis]GFN19802.1 vacuolar protein sorting-associated protein 4 [Aspergillus tubingensis]